MSIYVYHIYSSTLLQTHKSNTTGISPYNRATVLIVVAILTISVIEDKAICTASWRPNSSSLRTTEKPKLKGSTSNCDALIGSSVSTRKAENERTRAFMGRPGFARPPRKQDWSWATLHNIYDHKISRCERKRFKIFVVSDRSQIT